MNKPIPRLPGKMVALVTVILMLSAAADLFAQGKTITGMIRSDDGAPLPGASIVEKGTTNGTVTNADGIYSMTVSEGAVITVSFIGMKSTDITVGNQTGIDLFQVK